VRLSAGGKTRLLLLLGKRLSTDGKVYSQRGRAIPNTRHSQEAFFGERFSAWALHLLLPASERRPPKAAFCLLVVRLNRFSATKPEGDKARANTHLKLFFSLSPSYPIERSLCFVNNVTAFSAGVREGKNLSGAICLLVHYGKPESPAREGKPLCEGRELPKKRRARVRSCLQRSNVPPDAAVKEGIGWWSSSRSHS
jgi:hypothetical protein